VETLVRLYRQHFPIAQFAARLSEREELPDITPLLAAVSTVIPEEKNTLEEVPRIVEESSE